MNYADLQAAIIRTANRKNDPDFAAEVPNFIASAEAEMRREIRSRLETQTIVLDIDDTSYPLPAGFDGIVSINGTGAMRDIDLVSSDTLDKTISPAVNSYNIAGNMIYFARAPGEVQLRYRALFCPLSERNRCNWILDKHQDAYLYGALKHAAPWLEDDARIAMWAGLFNAAIDAINRQAIHQQFGGPLKIKSDRVDGGGHETRSTTFIFPVTP